MHSEVLAFDTSIYRFAGERRSGLRYRVTRIHMSPNLYDSFERLAVECGVRIVVEELYTAPRDLVCPPADGEQCLLVTLRGIRDGQTAMRFAYLAPLTQTEPLALRDVLWWLASDSWAIEQAGGDENAWAALHGYPPHDPASTRLFERHVRLAGELRAFLGPQDYQRLIGLYAREVSRPGPTPSQARRR